MLSYRITFQTVKALAEESERGFSESMSAIAEEIFDTAPDVVLISGPSGSGKTSCAKILSEKVAALGRAASTLSLDDFFYDVKDRKGKTEDLESVELLDADLLYYCAHQLLAGEPAHVPAFDFATGKRTFSGRQKILSGGELLVIEGIHALSPTVLDVFSDKKVMKLYVSVEGGIEFEDGTVADATEIRMLRRLVRDALFRATSPEKTLEVWKGVTASEGVNIIATRENADRVVNTYLAYEPYILRRQAARALESVSAEGEFASVREKFLPVFKKLPSASADLVPADSILHEFIG